MDSKSHSCMAGMSSFLSDLSRKKKERRQKASQKEEGDAIQSTAILILILGGLYVSIFLCALDRTIVSVAIPRITDEFHSIGDSGWYASAHMLGACCFQLLFGKIYKNYPPKIVLLTAISVFEIGSAICGAAPNSGVFILGRAIAGAGSTGIFTGAVVCTTYVIPLRRRPMVQGTISALFAVSSVLSPLLGGALTDHVSWRWCFYLNLPFGGAVILILFVFLKIPKPAKTTLSIKQKFLSLDPMGNSLLMGGLACLLLALQWGGSFYPWNNGRIISLLTIAGVLICSFIISQIWLGDAATVPPRIAKKRSIISGMVFAFCIGSAQMIFVYYLPPWFQAIKGVTAVQSGINTIPYALSVVVAAVVSGGATTRIGYFVPAMFLGPIVMTIGAGLLTTLKPDTDSAHWIGYQIILGFGMGFGQQVAVLSAQFVLPRPDVPIGVSLMLFSNQMGGAVFVSVAQTVFSNRLVKGVSRIAGIDSAAILNMGATELQNSVPASSIMQVLAAYNFAIVKTFLVGTVMAGIAILPAFTMEWKNVNVQKSVVKKKNEMTQPTTGGGAQGGVVEKVQDS